MADLDAAIGELVRQAVRAELAPVLEALQEPQGPALLDRAGLARSLGCSVSTVARLAREGCPRIMIGDAPRFELATVLEYLRERGGESCAE